MENRDRGRPRGLPLPHHRTYGSVSGGSLDQARAMFRAGAEGSDGVVRCVGFGPFEQRVRASPFPVAAKARYWNSAAWPTQGLRVYAFFQRSGLRQSALRLLCRLLTSVLRSDRLTASPVSFPRQQRRSPEVRPTAFAARPPDLPPRSLMAVDFAIICSLVRPGRPSIRFLSIGPRLCSALPSDPASRRRPCASLILRHHQAGWRTFTSKLSIMLGTQKKPRTRRGQ